MPWPRPTLSELRQAALDDVAASLKGSDPLLRFAVLRILAIITAGGMNQQYGYLDRIARDSVPFTARDEALYAWGSLKDINLKPATAARGSTTFSDCDPDILIAAGSLLVRGDGIEYLTDADVTTDGAGSAVVAATCMTEGADGNCPINTVLTLGNAIAGIQTDSKVSTAFVGGADIETQDEFRDRMLQAFRAPPQGGAAADYVEWAEQVAGVTRAWVKPLLMGAGTVGVYFMMDDVRSAFDGFPQGTNGVAALEGRAAPATGDQLLVADYIYPREPVPALVYLLAPTNEPVNFTIHGVADAGVRTAIAAAIKEVFRLQGSVGGTVDIESGAANGTTDLLDIEAAIATIPGAKGAVVTSPAANIVASAGALSTLGVITWT